MYFNQHKSKAKVILSAVVKYQWWRSTMWMCRRHWKVKVISVPLFSDPWFLREPDTDLVCTIYRFTTQGADWDTPWENNVRNKNWKHCKLAHTPQASTCSYSQGIKILTQCTIPPVGKINQPTKSVDWWSEEEKWHGLKVYGGTGFQKANSYKERGSEWDHLTLGLTMYNKKGI